MEDERDLATTCLIPIYFQRGECILFSGRQWWQYLIQGLRAPPMKGNGRPRPPALEGHIPPPYLGGMVRHGSLGRLPLVVWVWGGWVAGSPPAPPCGCGCGL